MEAFRKKDLALLGAFAPGSPELAAFLAAAEAMREDFDCAHVLDASLLAEVRPAMDQDFKGSGHARGL